MLIGVLSCQNISKKNNNSKSDDSPLTELSPKEDSIISNSEISIEVARILKFHTSNTIETLKTGNAYGELVSQDSLALCSSVDPKNKFKVLDRIIRDANSPDYSFICYYDDDDKPYIAVLKESNELNFIDKRGTQALNYDMYSKDLIAQLSDWEKTHEFKIIGVASDFIDIRFNTPPRQTKEFKEMVGNFCPDALDWLNEEEYILLMDEGSDYLNLWWD